MSFQSKGFWMAKGSGHLTDGDEAFDNPSRIEAKRSHQWFVDAAEPELFSSKKQAVQSPVGKSASKSLNTNVAPWDNPPSFQSVPNQFIDRLFGAETRPLNFPERVISPVGADISSMRRKVIDGQFVDVSADVGLSISHTMEDPEICRTYNGIRKVKVNEVKDCDNSMVALKGHDSNGENSGNLASNQVYSNNSSFISMGQPYDKVEDNVMIMGHNYSRYDSHAGSTGPAFGKGDDITVSISDTCNKGETSIISFGSFSDEHDIIPVARTVGSYDSLYNQPLQTLETTNQKELDTLNYNAAVSTTRVSKLKPESASKSKPELKASRKEAPNSFPSNVRSLISTGMLDGVPVKYVSLSREELRGVIKGSGYLCGCQPCNYSKVLNAYEFERHAGCKTKHPNNHIYFENGKTIYQIVQELKSTPESMLFEAIQTVFGAPINQKAFRSWKESFQAATRELQRIYGKEELNL